MKVRIIYSNTFDTAREAVLRVLRDNLGKGRHVLIVPDKFSLSYEIGVLERLNLEATFDVEVMSFSRFAATRLGSGANRCLTPEGEVMLMRRAADAVRDDLRFYRKASDNTDFAREMYGVISSLRNCGVFPDDLDGCGAEGETAAKIRDISLIYREYLSTLERNLEDGNTRLYAFADAIPNLDELTDTNVYVLDFYMFSDPQSAVLEQLVKYAASVTFGFIRGEEGAANGRLVPRRGADRINRICARLGISPETSAVLDESLPPYKKKILTDLFGYRKTAPAETGGRVELYRASTVSAEVEAVAERIRRLVSEEGMRYRDVAVVLSDPPAYASEIKRTLSRFEIPFYIDRRALFSEQPAARYILAALRCAESGFRFRDVLRLIKNPFFYGDDAGYGRTEEFENYCLENSVRGQLENLALSDGNAEKLRKRVLASAEAFVLLRGSAPAEGEAFREVRGSDCTEALRRFAEDNGLAAKCEAAAEDRTEQGMVSAQIYDKFSALLEEMDVTLSNAKLTLGSFADMLEAAFSNIKIALVPLYMDSVYVSDASTGRYDGCEVMFILGAGDGFFPSAVPDTAILGFAEESELLAKGLKIYPTRTDVLNNELFFLSRFLLKHGKKLIVSYPVNRAGGEAKPSQMMMQLTELLCENGRNLSIENLREGPPQSGKVSDYEDARAWAYRFSTLRNGVYRLLSDVASDSAGVRRMKPYDALYSLLDYDTRRRIDTLLSPSDGHKERVPRTAALKKGTFSASLLESYFSCPYKTYFSYGLNLKKRREGDLDARDTGTVLHAVMEEFVRGDYAHRDPSAVSEMINSVVSREREKPGMAGMRTLKHKAAFSRLINECEILCGKVREQMENSRFVPVKTEAKIGDLSAGAEIEGLSINAGDREYRLHGRVDRVDAADGYFTVVDYKSSVKSLSPKSVYNGTHIQPVLYAAALKRAGMGTPVGLLYQPLKTGYSKDEERFRMNGLVLRDVAVMKMLDTSVQPPKKSRFFPFKLNANGKPGQIGTVDGGIMDDMIEYAERLSAQALKELAAGNISPAPLSDDTCRNCDYFSVCPYAADDRYVRKDFPGINFEDFPRLLRGECPAPRKKKEGGKDA